MKDYINYVISVINPDGEEVNLPASKKDDKHIMSFLRLMYESWFDNTALMRYINDNDYKITGYEFSSFVAANGKVVFLPSDINNPENMIVTLPQVPENIQGRQVENIFPALEEFSVYACTAHFRKPRSPKIVTTPLCSSGDFEETYNKVKNYLSLSAMLNEPEHIENVNLVGKEK